LIFYALNAVTLFRLRAKKIGEEGCYRSPFFPALPIVFIAGIATLLGLRGWFRLADSIKDLAFIVTGIPFALYYCRRGPIGPAGYARLAALEVALVGALYYAYLCADRNSWQFAPIVAVGLAAAAALTVAHVKLDRRTAAV
jgi:hypothetical protein